MKGINDLLEPVTETQPNCYGQIAFPSFNYHGMTNGSSLMDTIGQYPPELLSLLGGTNISDEAGHNMMQCIRTNRASAGSDGSVKKIG